MCGCCYSHRTRSSFVKRVGALPFPCSSDFPNFVIDSAEEPWRRTGRRVGRYRSPERLGTPLPAHPHEFSTPLWYDPSRQPLGRSFVVVFVFFYADGLSLQLPRSLQGAPAPHERVEDHVAGVREVADDLFQDGDGLLRWVPPLLRSRYVRGAEVVGVLAELIVEGRPAAPALTRFREPYHGHHRAHEVPLVGVGHGVRNEPIDRLPHGQPERFPDLREFGDLEPVHEGN